MEVLAVDEFAELSNIPVDDAAGMAKAGDLLYILAGSGALHTYDIADLEDPVAVHYQVWATPGTWRWSETTPMSPTTRWAWSPSIWPILGHRN